MNTKTRIVLLMALITAFVHFAEAQEPKKIPRIGSLSGGSPSSSAPRVEAFRQGLRALGYIDGQNIAFEHRYAEGNLDRVPDFVAELIGLKVDVIVLGTEQAIRAAQQATKTIPIVMAATGNPVAAGFVASLARPGGNITGTTTLSSETIRKRLDLLKEAVPELTFLGVVWNPSNVV